MRTKPSTLNPQSLVRANLWGRGSAGEGVGVKGCDRTSNTNTLVWDMVLCLRLCHDVVS